VKKALAYASAFLICSTARNTMCASQVMLAFGK